MGRLSFVSRLLLFIFYIGCFQVGYSQYQSRYERLTSNSGLSQNTVVKIIQDKSGFLWFATADGLNRYDGYSFKVFKNDPSDVKTLSGSDIFSVTEDDQGNLWVGTRGAGLNKIIVKTGEIIRLGKGLNGEDWSNFSIPSIANLGNNKICVAYYGLGTIVYNTLTNQIIEEESFSHDEILKNVARVYKDSKGSIWVGTIDGQLVALLGKKSIIPFNFGPNKTKLGIRIRVIYEVSNGELLVGTEGAGLYQFDPKKQSIKRVFYNNADPKARENNVTSITKDALGNLWIGTDKGIYIGRKDDFSKPTYIPSSPDLEQGISSFSVTALFTDTNQNVWIGTWEAGLNINYFQQPRFSVFRYKPNTVKGLLSNKVTTLAVNDNNGVWIGCNFGLSYFNFRTAQIDHLINSNVNNKLSATNNFDVNLTYADPFTKSMWVGVWQKGLVEITAQRKKIEYPYLLDNYAKNISAIYGQKDRILLGTSGIGLIAFDLKSKKYYTPYPELGTKNFANKNITKIFVEDNRTIWIGTSVAGLYIYDIEKRQIEHIEKNNQANGLRYNFITGIFKDSKKRIWILTNGGGLHQFLGKGKGFKVYTESDGLASNTLRAIMEDKKGFLWVTTNGGISKIDGKSLKIVNFDDSDGLQGREFLMNSFAQNTDNWLFFGGVNGLNYIKADSLRMKLEVPPVSITNLKIFNKNVTATDPNSPLKEDILFTKHLILQPEHSVFSLDFVALEYQRPKNNRYAYFLEGFEKDWNYVGTQRTATYTNLSPGDYIFKVKATNSDGVWSEKSYDLKITVLPPWYRTWWAYAIYVLMFGGSLMLYIREIRIRERFKTDLRLKEIEKERIKELEQVKTHFFTNISHELRTPLTLIISPIEKYFLKNNSISVDQKSKISSVHQNAKKLLHLINQLLDLSKIESGKQHPIITKNDLIPQLNAIVQRFETYAVQKNIKLKWKTPVSSLLVYYDAEIIEKIINNLLSNAFKYTPDEGSIGVQLSFTEKYLNQEKIVSGISIDVMDTGKGISEQHLPHIFDRFYQIPDSMAAVGTGVGLSLCKELAQLHLGSISVQSKLGVGSTFRLEIPVDTSSFEKEWFKQVVDTKQIEEKVKAITSLKTENAIIPEKQIMLIVEDHEELRTFVADIFSKKFQVVEASTGEEALEIALELIPDIIITDWMMPGMSGINLCKALRSNTKTNHIPTIILTSKSSQESQIEGMQSGADDYVSKPFNSDILEIRVAKLLEAKERLRTKLQQTLFQEEIQKDQPLSATFEDEFLRKITQFVIDNMANPDLSIEDLEKGMDMSKMQLYRKLKNVTSLSGNEFIRSVRLKESKALLQSGDLNISEVAYRVGFNDPGYFTRAFKKQFGKSPKVYIQEKNNEK